MSFIQSLPLRQQYEYMFSVVCCIMQLPSEEMCLHPTQFNWLFSEPVSPSDLVPVIVHCWQEQCLLLHVVALFIFYKSSIYWGINKIYKISNSFIWTLLKVKYYKFTLALEKSWDNRAERIIVVWKKTKEACYILYFVSK